MYFNLIWCLYLSKQYYLDNRYDQQVAQVILNYGNFENGFRLISSHLDTQNYIIPGYSGHCPTLKFQFGKCYGACTREIIQSLSQNGIICRSTETGATSSQSQTASEIPNQKYILGYTGYIPGMYRHYPGQSFRQIAELCETKTEKSVRYASGTKKR